MKRKMNSLVLTVIFTLLLCGCSGSADVGQEIDASTGRTDEPYFNGSDSADGGQEIDASAISSLGGRDYSLYVYSATLNAPLRVENPEGSMAGGGTKFFMGVSRACYFKKHVFDVERLKDCWDELAYVTDAGEKGAICFDFENQLWGVGFAAGTNHYVALDYEMQADGEEYQYFFTERDDNQEVLRKFPLDFLRGSDLSEVIMSLSDFAVDASGVVHIMRQMGEEMQYLLISPEGELLAEYILEEGYIMRLVPLYDGHVALWTVAGPRDEGQGMRMTLQCMDQEAGKPIMLATSEQEFYCFTLLDENTTLCANETGVYCGDLSGNNLEPLYLWSSHGLTVFGVSAIRADAEGKIALIYEDFEGYNYLCMEPTSGEVASQEITLAVSPARMSFYQNVVAAFNNQYPNCHIVLKDDYDRTVLLTELTAGKGPVLIDTLLTGFEEHEKLWEPLDNILEQQGIMDELQPTVLELGRINGTLYGVTTNFSLRTLVTGDSDLKDWDYDTFLQCVEDRPDLEAIFNLYGGDYGTYFIMNFISHGIDDNYLFDAATGKMNFDSSGFRRALELAQKYCVREEAVRPGRSLLEGKVLCNVLSITRPEQLALYRVCYGENANYIGYPARDGAAHFIESSNLLAIRRTATEEEKEVAGAFISLCLSYEGQLLASKDLNFYLSVRKDVLEEQIAAMDQNTVAYVVYFDEFRLGDDLNIERDRETLLDLIGKARPMKYFPVELQNILFEELEPYFSGAITEDMVISHLESRVGLYLEERK